VTRRLASRVLVRPPTPALVEKFTTQRF